MAEPVKEEAEKKKEPTEEIKVVVEPSCPIHGIPPSAFLEFSEVLDDEFYHISMLEPILEVETKDEEKEEPLRLAEILHQIPVKDLENDIQFYYDTIAPDYRRIALAALKAGLDSAAGNSSRNVNRRYLTRKGGLLAIEALNARRRKKDPKTVIYIYDF